jgi:hypothetical protein
MKEVSSGKKFKTFIFLIFSSFIFGIHADIENNVL